MNDALTTIVLVLAIIAVGWIVWRVVSRAGAGGESSARADTLATGAGYGAERIDTPTKQAVRRPIVGGGGGNA